MEYRVELDPLKQVIVKGAWPQTVIGKGKLREAGSPESAIHEVADEYGISSNVLKATPLKGLGE